MIYKVDYTKRFEKDFARLSKEVKQVIWDKFFPILKSNPNYGTRFVSNKLRLWKIKFRHKRNDYRIAYTINRGKLLVLLIAVAPRENFYNRMKVRKLL